MSFFQSLYEAKPRMMISKASLRRDGIKCLAEASTQKSKTERDSLGMRHLGLGTRWFEKQDFYRALMILIWVKREP
jgi:hypothetical protein